MQAHPDAEARKRLAQLGEPRLDGRAAPRAFGIFQVHAIGARVLADDQEFLDALGRQRLGFRQHIAGGAARQGAAQGRNDAEGAGIVAAFGDFQIGVMRRRQAEPRARHKLQKRRMRGGGRYVDRVHDGVVLMRAGHGEHVREGLADALVLDAEAAGDDHAAIFGHGLADGFEAFGLRAIEKSTGVYHHDIGAVIAWGNRVALGAQARQNPLGIHQRLRAAKADKADFGRCLGLFFGCLHRSTGSK